MSCVFSWIGCDSKRGAKQRHRTAQHTEQGHLAMPPFWWFLGHAPCNDGATKHRFRTTVTVHGWTSPPSKNKMTGGILVPTVDENHRAHSAISSTSSFGTTCYRGGASAALGTALIRRCLVTHWGLSTFPGSGVSSCGRLT